MKTILALLFLASTAKAQNITYYGPVGLYSVVSVTAASSITASAFFGDGSHLTGGVPPGGAAGGDLTGTFPSPTIAAGAVTDSKVNLTTGAISSGKFTDARVSITTGAFSSSFNGASQLVQLNASSQLPAVSGALLTNLPASGFAGGGVANATTFTSSVTMLSSASATNFQAITGTFTNTGNGPSGYSIQASSGINIQTSFGCLTFNNGSEGNICYEPVYRRGDGKTTGNWVGSIVGIGGGGNNARNRNDTVGGGDTNTTAAGNTNGRNVIAGGTSNSIDATYSVIGGGQSNSIAGTGNNQTVGGGGSNTNAGVYASIGGGLSNSAGSATAGYNTVSGGRGNTATSDANNNSHYATVAGGFSNTAAGFGMIVSGGQSNTATNNGGSEQFATVGGGNGNKALGEGAWVGGGENNTAQGRMAMAYGFNSAATAAGALMVNDNRGLTDIKNNIVDNFMFRDQGGHEIFTSSLTVISDSTKKVLFSVDATSTVSTGLQLSSSSIPSVACNAGTGVISAAATNSHGTFTAGVGAANCTVTFTTAFPKTPDCVCADDSSILALSPTNQTTSVKCTAAASMSGDTITYLCFGAP